MITYEVAPGLGFMGTDLYAPGGAFFNIAHALAAAPAPAPIGFAPPARSGGNGLQLPGASSMLANTSTAAAGGPAGIPTIWWAAGGLVLLGGGVWLWRRRRRAA